MKKYQIVRDSILFENIIKKGDYMKNNFYIIYNKDNNLNYPRFGIAVGKKIGNAVTRNKIKRQIRMILTNNQNIFKNNKDYIIMVKKNILELNYQQMQENILKILK